MDDEALILDLTVSMCKKIPLCTEVEGFTRAYDALERMDEYMAEIALLDIDMPEMDGIMLASKMREKNPDIVIIFLTGYTQYAVDAFEIHASGYLMKPISLEKLTEELEYAAAGRTKREESRVNIRTFGNFDVYADGQLVKFSRSKAKELFAYLVDRQGSSVNRNEAFAVLWEKGMYDRSKQKQLDVIIRSLRATLEEYGIGEILEMSGGALRVCPEKTDCDLYRFLNGEPDEVNSYRGEYMTAYSWASLTEAYLDGLNNR